MPPERLRAGVPRPGGHPDPLAIPAIPATLVATAVGTVTTAAGLPPESIPAVLLASGDVSVYASAVAVAFAAAWRQDRLSPVR